MSLLIKYFFLVTILIVQVSSLHLNLTQGQLPGGAFRHTAIYDGDDSIFICGGFGNPGYSNQAIYRYSITSDVVQEVGSLPWPSLGIAMFLSGESDIIFYGIAQPASRYFYNPDFSYVYKFNTVSFEGEVIRQGGRTLIGLGYSQVGNSDGGLLFGGQAKFGITKFNLTTMDFEFVSELPLRHPDQVSGVFDGIDSCYIFGQGSPGLHMVKYSLNTDSITEWDTTTVDIFYPDYPLSQPQGVWDGRHIYIIGGSGRVGGANGDDVIVQYDPLTNVATSHPVVYVESPAHWKGMQFTAPIYVEKLNRVYIIGGFIYNNRMKEIWYMDLNVIENM